MQPYVRGELEHRSALDRNRLRVERGVVGLELAFRQGETAPAERAEEALVGDIDLASKVASSPCRNEKGSPGARTLSSSRTVPALASCLGFETKLAPTSTVVSVTAGFSLLRTRSNSACASVSPGLLSSTRSRAAKAWRKSPRASASRANCLLRAASPG